MAKQDIGKVVAWMAGALVSFSALAIAVRELAGQISVFEILAIRNIGGIVLIGAYALARDHAAFAWPRMPGLHLLRNFFHFCGQTAWAYGLTVLPLATVFALEFTTPAWTMVLATLFLRERVTPARLVALVLGFAGVLIILRPGASAFQPAGLVVLAAAVMFAVQITTTKYLTASQSVTTILFWMNVIQLPMYEAAHFLASGTPWIGAGLHITAWPWLALLCVGGLTAHICLTSAFRHGDATTVVPIDFLRIPVIATVGALAYGERFDAFVLLGAAVSAAGIVWSLRDARMRQVRGAGRTQPTE
jgi:drug/metabolite transporter (DMT)-like permease